MTIPCFWLLQDIGFRLFAMQEENDDELIYQTIPISDPAGANGISQDDLQVSNGWLYFQGKDDAHGTEL